MRLSNPLLFRGENRDWQRGAILAVFDPNISLRALYAAFRTAPTVHGFVNLPDGVRVLAVVTIERPPFQIADRFDVQKSDVTRAGT